MQGSWLSRKQYVLFCFITSFFGSETMRQFQVARPRILGRRKFKIYPVILSKEKVVPPSPPHTHTHTKRAKIYKKNEKERKRERRRRMRKREKERKGKN